MNFADSSQKEQARLVHQLQKQDERHRWPKHHEQLRDKSSLHHFRVVQVPEEILRSVDDEKRVVIAKSDPIKLPLESHARLVRGVRKGSQSTDYREQ